MRSRAYLTLATLTTLMLGLSACVVEETPVENDPDPIVSGLPPDPGAAGKVTVQGTDSDADGLRDDVQIYVYTTYSDPATRAAAIQLAKSFQALLTTGSTKPNALTAAASMNLAIDCLYSRDADKFGDRVDEVESAVVNTGDRMRAYARAGAFLSGGSYSVSTVANNANSCVGTP